MVFSLIAARVSFFFANKTAAGFSFHEELSKVFFAMRVTRLAFIGFVNFICTGSENKGMLRIAAHEGLPAPREQPKSANIFRLQCR